MSWHRSIRNSPAEGCGRPALCVQEKEQEPADGTKWAVALCTVDGQRYWTQCWRLFTSDSSAVKRRPSLGCLWATGPTRCRWPRCPGRWFMAPPSTCWDRTLSTDMSAWTATLRTIRRSHWPNQVWFSFLNSDRWLQTKWYLDLQVLRCRQNHGTLYCYSMKELHFFVNKGLLKMIILYNTDTL